MTSNTRRDFLRQAVVRSRQTPNAALEIGYRSAIACHMANLAFRNSQRVTLEEAKAIAPQF